MKVLTGKFISWLMRQTILMRYFVIAVLVHVLVLLVMGSIKIVNATMPHFDEIQIGFVSSEDKKGGGDTPVVLPDVKNNPPPFGDNGPHGPNSVGTSTPPGPDHKVNLPVGDFPAINVEVIKVIGHPSDTTDTPVRPPGDDSRSLPGPTRTGFDKNEFPPNGLPGNWNHGIGSRSDPERSHALTTFNGTPASEKAVLAALRWFKEHQNKDGSWGSSNADALTALGLLSFLGHGATADSEEFGATVTKSITYLVATVGEDGYVKSKNMYAQGAVTLALSEAYGMTQSALVRAPLERLIQGILQAQQITKPSGVRGGWRYSPLSADSDTSVSGWIIMGLKSARMAGVPVPEEAYQMAGQYLWNMYDAAGGFAYVLNGSRAPGMTAVGVLCQMFLDHGDNPKIKKALDYLKQQKVDWDHAPSGSPLYAWYYMTQAMFQGGGGYWDYWNNQIRDTLVKAQDVDGHWDAPSPQEKQYGPTYPTALCCLSLEVYYRYLPIYKEMEHKAPSPTM